MSNNQAAILVGIDSTEKSLTALESSYNLAHLTNARIVFFDISAGNAPKKIDDLVKDATAKTGSPVEVMSAKDNINSEFKKVADVLRPLFIILGLSPQASKGNIFGKNIFSALREIKSPVVTIVGDALKTDIKTILLPLDLSKESREKVYHAVDMARAFDAEVRIASILTKMDEEYENKMLAYSNQAWKLIKAENIRCKIKTLRGKHAPQLVLDYAKEVGADVVMIMRQEELGFMDMFSGTCDAERIMGGSEIPVISYHPIQRRDTSVFIK